MRFDPTNLCRISSGPRAPSAVAGIIWRKSTLKLGPGTWHHHYHMRCCHPHKVYITTFTCRLVMLAKDTLKIWLLQTSRNSKGRGTLLLLRSKNKRDIRYTIIHLPSELKPARTQQTGQWCPAFYFKELSSGTSFGPRIDDVVSVLNLNLPRGYICEGPLHLHTTQTNRFRLLSPTSTEA